MTKKKTNSCLIIRALDAELSGDVEELSFGVFSAFFRGVIVPERCRFCVGKWSWWISRRPREACSCCLPDFEGPKAACLPAGVRCRARGVDVGFMMMFLSRK